jgi:2-polyprenyl-3-methyl-5-hydroxy-6-metoxy-1,4-benzoquinol methylase
MDNRYYNKYAVAAVRGALKRLGKCELLPEALIEKELDVLAEKECDEILEKAEISGIKLYHFKATHNDMPRVKKVLGFLRGIYFESLLDVGSGRGVFLIPFMENFPYVNVTSLDILDKRVEMLENISNGGVSSLNVINADICNQPFADNSFDVVTMLEVLEHIPDAEAAIRAAVKMARSYVVVTVPSKEDDNPEHIHLLTQSKLTEYFGKAGVTKLSFDGVPGHLFMIAKVN